MKYLFKLGHQPEISKAEIFSLIEQQGKWCGIADQKDDLLILTSEEIDPEDLMKRLGGTIYIAEKINPEGENLQEKVLNYLVESSDGNKIDFAISGLNSEELLMPTKKKLQEKGHSARFVKLENTASIKYNNLVEQESHINIFKEELYVTKAIHPFEQMKKHGRDRPEADPESGMLPPKLSRILLNLAQVRVEDKLLDSFCGSGTVLMEAASIGLEDIVGNDLEQKAVEASRKNLEWLKKEEGLDFEYDLLNQPSEKISEYIKEGAIDKIVTEPYLGDPRTGDEDKSELKQRAHNLRRLYIDVFYEFKEILKQKGEIVFIIPKFKHKDGWIRVDCVDEIKKAGLEVVPFENNENLFYAREDQLVGREIWKFRSVK